MILGFGEVMARFCPPDRARWRQALPGRVEVTWGGGEANVCASLAMLGESTRYVTALPRNALSESLVASLRGLGVDTSRILWRGSGRLGLYFVEPGTNQRASTVLYDRESSAVSLAGPEEYAWDAILQGVEWLHVTGITPAIGAAACAANLELVKRARSLGVTVSCDLNFRKKLWRWRPGTDPAALARECMSQVLAHTDLVVANEEDAADVLGIHAQGTNVAVGQLDVGGYEGVARRIVARYPGISRVAITLRESISADHNNWGAMLFDGPSDTAHFAPCDEGGNYRPYEIRDIIDRIGAGDSFAAGLIHGLRSSLLGSPRAALEFAVAASCLKHSLPGDFNYTSRDEILALRAGNATGRVQR
ncbi:MAG: sugar kinase [Planctomycetes bacterium]|nr:sugar kinase [Planctomycetota bacterium]